MMRYKFGLKIILHCNLKLVSTGFVQVFIAATSKAQTEKFLLAYSSLKNAKLNFILDFYATFHDIVVMEICNLNIYSYFAYLNWNLKSHFTKIGYARDFKSF